MEILGSAAEVRSDSHVREDIKGADGEEVIVIQKLKACSQA